MTAAPAFAPSPAGSAWVRRLLALTLAWCAAAAGAADGDARQLEAQVKAAYLYKFASHVEWPPAAYADASTPFTIGVVGAGDIAEELQRLQAGRSVNERPVEVRVLKGGESARGVQLVFVGGGEGVQLRRLLEPFKATPTLTVSDMPGAIEAGSVINFMLVDKRLRFEVSLANAERHGLKVSSRLLAVALRVDAGRRE
ncbi:MAG TPA: YfiR family protein [Roseateles sp.]